MKINIIYTTELHKVFKFGIFRYLVASPHEYGALVHGILNPIKNCIFIPMGMEGSYKGHDGIMYNTFTGMIESTVQMKHYTGNSIFEKKGLINLVGN